MSIDSVPSPQWSTQLSVAPQRLPGDKIVLPQSALEQLLAAATVTVEAPASSQSYTSTFDPYNPYSHAAERHARAQFAERQPQLPHPLTFRLVNPENGRIVYAGIREFSAEEGKIGLGGFLLDALGVKDGFTGQDTQDGDVVTKLPDVRPPELKITIHSAKLPKGTYVRLRPLEAGYDPEDWKSLLERYLRDNFTTLTNGEVLSVSGGRPSQQFRFLVDKLAPEGEGICIVDTDLEVDIEPLDEEQARETLKRRLAKSQRVPGISGGSSAGGVLELGSEEQGQVLASEFVDYEVSAWNRADGIQIEVDAENDAEDIDLFVSPLSPRQRARPRDDDYVFSDLSGRPAKRIRLQPTNVELEDAEAVWISVHAYGSLSGEGHDNTTSNKIAPLPYRIRVTAVEPSSPGDEDSSAKQNNEQGAPEEVRCKNCHQWVPQRTLFLHENFCLRNNVLCPKCQNVFIKTSTEWKTHWHCPHDSSHGTTTSSHAKHDATFHTPRPCPSCAHQAPNLPALAHHRTTTCPGKLILCQFCHLLVPQQSDSDPLPTAPDVLLSGLTPHEFVDGARTTECHLCGNIVRLRHMNTHLRAHDLDRRSRPMPRICRNLNCARTLDGVGRHGDVGAGKRMGQGAGNELALCSICFGPLYVSLYDPDGRALRRRVERRYLTQLLTGCGKGWCRNGFCKSGRKNSGLAGEREVIAVKEALEMVRPFVEGVVAGGREGPLHFCVDEGSQRRRGLAEMVVAEGGYALEWCVAALEAEGGDLERARGWLRDWAASRAEVGSG